jgi:hypothetical protein
MAQTRDRPFLDTFPQPFISHSNARLFSKGEVGNGRISLVTEPAEVKTFDRHMRILPVIHGRDACATFFKLRQYLSHILMTLPVSVTNVFAAALIFVRG